MVELRPYNPTLRERTKQNIAGALTNLGMDNYMAQRLLEVLQDQQDQDLNMARSIWCFRIYTCWTCFWFG